MLIISDLHCGSKVGLTPPEFKRKYKDGLLQGYDSNIIWKWYLKKIKEIGVVDYLICNGDAVDGPAQKNTIGQLTTNTDEQAEIAIECIKQIKYNKLYMTYGTPYHVAGSYLFEKTIAKELECSIKDTQRRKVNDVRFNIRHVVGTSATPYGQGTLLYKEAIRELVDSSTNRETEADVIIRAHAHYYHRDETSRKIAIINPCLQFPQSVYGLKCRGFYYDMGMTEINISPIGNVEIIPHIMPLNIVVKRDYES